MDPENDTVMSIKKYLWRLSHKKCKDLQTTSKHLTAMVSKFRGIKKTVYWQRLILALEINHCPRQNSH